MISDGAPRYWAQLVIGAIFLASVADLIYRLR
jgi:hypothetical protein